MVLIPFLLARGSIFFFFFFYFQLCWVFIAAWAFL